MAERQPMTSEQRKEIAKRRREKAAAAATAQLEAIDEDQSVSVPETKIGSTKPPKRKTGPSIADLNPMEEILINREEANKQLQEVELMRRRMVARAEDIERRALDRKLSAARYAAAKQELEAGLRRNEDAASSHPTARSSAPVASTARTDPMASSRAVSEYSYPASQYSSESDMARVNRPAGRVSSPDAVPALNLFPHGSRFTKPSEDQRDRARATAAVERAKRKPSEEVKAKARQAAEARRMRELEQASLSRPSLEQGSLSRPSLEQGSLSRPSVASGSLAQPSIASDMAVKHNLQEASVSERRAEELARRAKLVREVERAQADVAATAERVSTRSRNEADDEFGATPLHPEVAACRKMWARPNDMDADSTSSEDEGPVPTRVPPSVLRRKMKQRKAKRVQREARKAEASAPTDDKRALREYVQTATERVSGGDASKALNTATAEVARARREAEQLAQQARALRAESSDESSESEYSDGPGMDAALKKRQEDDLKKARREAQYADLETKRALAKARVQEEMERVKFIRRSIAEKNLADTRAQEAEAAKKDAKQQKKAVETIKMIAKKRAQSPVKPRAPVKQVPTDKELLQGEVAAFFLREPPREQLRFLKFALEPEQKKDLPAVAVAFRHANKPEQVMHDRTFDNAVLVEHICLDLEHQHVAYLRPYCLLLGVLIGRKPNLRKALLMGIVKILNGRMKGREKETFAKTPTLIAQSMDACRELMMRLVWGKSQGQLRDSWNPERLSAKAEVARAQKKTPAPTPAPAQASPDAATVKESASYWNKRKAAEGIEVDRGPLCRIKALRAHVPTEAMEMRMRKGDTLIVKRDELDGEPGWIFALKGSDAGYIPRANLLIDSSPARGARGVSFTDGHT